MSGSFRSLLVDWFGDNSLPVPGQLTHEHSRRWQGIGGGPAEGKMSERPRQEAISGHHWYGLRQSLENRHGITIPAMAWKFFMTELFRSLAVDWSSDNSLSAPGALTRELARSSRGIVFRAADWKTTERPRQEAFSGHHEYGLCQSFRNGHTTTELVMA